jgi:hypothetical protein
MVVGFGVKKRWFTLYDNLKGIYPYSASVNNLKNINAGATGEI